MPQRRPDADAVPSRLVAAFAEVHGAAPARLGSAPGRVNLIGEHTDYNAGLCLPVALPHRTFVAATPRADDLVRLASRQSQDRWEGRLGEVAPGAVPGWAAYVVGVLWCLREAGLDVGGADLVVDSAVPVGAGLSSSAALECAVAAAVLDVETADTQQVVDACRRAEAEFADAPTGGLDQTIAMRAEEGHALLIDFQDGAHGQVAVPDGPVVLVVDTRVSHALNDGGYAARRQQCEDAAAALGVPSLRAADLGAVEGLDDDVQRRRARHVVTEIGRVTAAVDALEDADWVALGRLFLASHASLRDDFEVSCPELDAVVETAVHAGALGARMTGGGFGGSAIALVDPGEVEPTVGAVERTFAERGWDTPDWLVAVPSAGARAEPLP